MARGGPQREWRGSIAFAGFPVNVTLYKPMKKTRTESFKVLAPDGLPPVSKKYQQSDGKELVGGETLRGVETSKGVYAILPEEARESISQEKSRELEVDHFAPRSTIPFEKAIATYAVGPTEDVPGAGQAVNIVWNGLKAQELTYVCQMSKRGAMDCVMAFWADERGMWATELPFAAEILPQPIVEFTENADAQRLFAQVVEQQYEVTEDFEHDRFESEYKARRAAAIEAVLDGKSLPAPAPEKVPEAIDLMAVLAASVGEKVPA